MPLSYSVRDQASPDRTIESQGNFIDDTIDCMPLSGTHFQADTRKAHHLLKNDLVAGTAEQWTSSIEKRVNGWDEFDALRRHYRSEGNVSRRVATVDRLQDIFHYKNDRALSFNTFLDRMQKIFNIFRDEG